MFLTVMLLELMESVWEWVTASAAKRGEPFKKKHRRSKRF